MEKILFAKLIHNNAYTMYTENGSCIYKNPELLKEYTHVIIFKKLSQLSSTQFISWVSLSDWFDSFEPFSPELKLPLVFYSIKESCLYICSESGLSKVSMKLDDWITKIPTMFGYAEEVDKLTIKQFLLLTEKKWTLKKPTIQKAQHSPITEIKENKSSSKKKYLHCKYSGNIRLRTVKMNNQDVELDGKFYFVDLDTIGGFSVLENKEIKRYIKENKIEVVDHDHYLQNKGRYIKLSNELIMDKPADKLVAEPSSKDTFDITMEEEIIE